MHDLFISHASEDKSEVARPLAERLIHAGLDVWYDEFSLKLGDSLLESINRGLADSFYGVVILSKPFLNKKWPKDELGGLFAKEVGGHNVLLPVWHNLTRDELLAVYPMLADRVAARTKQGLDSVVDKILDVIDPEKAHKSRVGQVATVTPTRIELHSGDWEVRTPIQVCNPSDHPVFEVWVKIAIEPTSVPPKSIEVSLAPLATMVAAKLPILGGAITMSPDQIAIFGEDEATGQPVVLLKFHTIPPRACREVIARGTHPVRSAATISLARFDAQPTAVVQRAGQAGMPLRPPVSIRVHEAQVLLAKR